MTKRQHVHEPCKRGARFTVFVFVSSHSPLHRRHERTRDGTGCVPYHGRHSPRESGQSPPPPAWPGHHHRHRSRLQSPSPSSCRRCESEECEYILSWGCSVLGVSLLLLSNFDLCFESRLLEDIRRSSDGHYRAWPASRTMRSDLRPGGRGKVSRGAILVTYNVGARVHVPAPREQDPEGRARADGAAKRLNLIASLAHTSRSTQTQ